MESFTREQIKNILAQKYRVAYGVYEQLERTGKELIDERDLGDFTLGRYAWEFSDMVQIAPPIPVRGAQGLWEWSEHRIP